MVTQAVTFKNYSDYFCGVWVFFVCLDFYFYFFKKEEIGKLTISSLFKAIAAMIKSYCNLHEFDGFAAKFTQKF